MSEEQETPDQSHPYLENKVIIMNGFTYDEITRIMRSVKGMFENPKDLIFAKTTENSLEMKLKDLIIDMSEDHEYLKNNPPNTQARNSQGGSQQNDSKQNQSAQASSEQSGSESS